MGAIQSACALGWIGIAGPSRQCPEQRYKYANENTRHKHSKANANMQNAGRNAKTKTKDRLCKLQMCLVQSVFADLWREKETKPNSTMKILSFQKCEDEYTMCQKIVENLKKILADGARGGDGEGDLQEP